MSESPEGEHLVFREPTNKTRLKGNAREARRIIRQLDNDQKNDLGIHLYSSFLLHHIHPQFPPRSFVAWPLSADRVPIPGGSQLYTEIPDQKDRHELSQKDINIPKPKLKRNPVAPVPAVKREYLSTETVPDEVLQEEADDEVMELTDLDEGDTESEAEADSDQQDQKPQKLFQMYMTETQRRKQLKKNRKLANPADELKLEIDALFKRKIVEKIRTNPNPTYHTLLSIDHLQTPEWVHQRIVEKLDTLTQSFPNKIQRRIPLFDWRSVLAQADVRNRVFLGHMKYIFVTSAQTYLASYNERLSKESDYNSGAESDELEKSVESEDLEAAPQNFQWVKRLKMMNSTYDQIIEDIRYERRNDGLKLNDLLID